MHKSSTLINLEKIILKDIEIIPNIKILEFGVNYGNSTKFFLNICNKNGGTLTSVDIEESKKEIKSPNWKFIKSRDDNFELIEEHIKNDKFDLIFLDTEHTAKHAKKIFYHYYKYLKINGYFLIDDICWLPYLKKNYRDNEWIEVNNKKTFEILMEILNGNNENIDLEFCMSLSGIAKIKKIKDMINPPKKIFGRDRKLKQKIKEILNLF